MHWPYAGNRAGMVRKWRTSAAMLRSEMTESVIVTSPVGEDGK
jgi:hypothetical protein